MAREKQAGELELDQDMTFHWREWRVQRIAWIVWALILLASLVGLFGHGPLSRGNIAAPGGDFSITYERIDRYRAPSHLTITLGAGAVQEGRVRLTLNREFLDRLEIERVVPEPESVEASGANVLYTFQVSEAAPLSEIRFDFEHDRAGLAHAEVGLESGPRLAFDSFVFP
jgi:hypothetical protein